MFKSIRFYFKKNKISNYNGYSSNDNKGLLTTVVLKVALNSQGCIDKIHKLILGFEGVTEMSLDKHKQLVTVKGTMDCKVLAEYLKDTLNRPVEIEPPMEDDEGKESNDRDNGCNGYNARGYMLHNKPGIPIQTTAIDCEYNARGYMLHDKPGIPIETTAIDCEYNARGYMAHDIPGIPIEIPTIDCEYNARGYMANDVPGILIETPAIDCKYNARDVIITTVIDCGYNARDIMPDSASFSSVVCRPIDDEPLYCWNSICQFMFYKCFFCFSKE
ncbi:hypothetical protein JRO89_XS02G0285200 [Xanthoceras sorbifolium]|uniref:HMA domain-containing protein n=1 Tax=Xanthoceras sorbifolium TaxID=99658 RepID=A0ABQ8IHA4_9ROSI|nr:hypothetical protein JRO89_XS02G0285200 [Xanthoceras sorbifolium]